MYAGARFANEMKVSTFFLLISNSIPSHPLPFLSCPNFSSSFLSLFYFPRATAAFANDIASAGLTWSKTKKKNGETLAPKGDLPFKDKVPPILLF